MSHHQPSQPKQIGCVLVALLLCLSTQINAQTTETGEDVVSATNPNQSRQSIRTHTSNAQSPFTSSDLRQKSKSSVQSTPRIDGAANNSDNVNWGRADIPFQRLAAPDYGDGQSSLAGGDRPSARVVSNILNIAQESPPKGAPVSDLFWQWGQFLDHDITLTPEVTPEQRADIPILRGDRWFDPQGVGGRVMHFNRSTFSVDQRGVRQQHNAITAYIDASNVYGSDPIRQSALRRNDGSGKLKTSAGNLLPFNEARLANAPSDSPRFFLAGDFRANEQVGLTAMHTVFVREHNRLASQAGNAHPDWDEDQRYEYARSVVAALMQHITYSEFLPKLLGRFALPGYTGYKVDVDASISNEFATAAFRVGHTMLSSQLLRLDAQGKTAVEGHLSLRDAFFRPDQIQRFGIESVLRGLCRQRAQKVDLQIVDDVRNVLFRNQGEGLDLAALNIQRGRDHGLASYNDTRRALGLEPVSRFEEISRNSTIQRKLAQVYPTTDHIDLWIGGLAETPKTGSMVGETFYQILVDQFVRLRDGDRFWFENQLSPALQAWVKTQTLSKVIQRNSTIGKELPNLAMQVPNTAALGAILPLLIE